MVAALAWRNVVRNWRRSLITAAAVAIGLAAMLVLWGVNDGGHNAMIRNFQDTLVGSLQIHKRGYFKKPRLETHIEAPAAIRAALRSAGVERWTERLSGFMLAAGQEASLGLQVVGVDPAREPLVTDLARRLREGRLLVADDERVALLDAGAARRLGIGLGDHLVLLGQDRYGGLAAERMTLVGILGDSGADAEGGIAFAPLRAVQDMLGMEDRITEVVVRSENAALDGLAARVRAALGAEDLEVLRWFDMYPLIMEGVALDNGFNYIFFAIVLVIVIAGVVNTVLVSTIQRTREFGILMALGTSRLKIAAILGAESAFIGLAGCGAGIAIGLGAVGYLNWVGIDLSAMGESLTRFYFDPVIRPEIDTDHLLITVLGLVAAIALSALYPAYRAMQLSPVEAIAHV